MNCPKCNHPLSREGRHGGMKQPLLTSENGIE